MVRESAGHPSDGTTEFAEEDGRSNWEMSYSLLVSLSSNVGSGDEADLACMTALFWGKAVSMGRWDEDLETCWRRQVRAPASWKEVRGPAEAVVCETRDLGIRFPSWHVHLFEDGIIVDMKVAYTQDMKNMPRRQAKEVVEKRWATKHEYEELTDGVWVEPLLALPTRKTNQKIEGGCTQQRLYDLGWSDEKGAKEKKEPKSTGCSHCPTWKDVVDKMLDDVRKWEQKPRSQNVKEKMEMAQRAGILTSQERRMENKSSDGEHVVTIDGSQAWRLWMVSGAAGSSWRARGNAWVHWAQGPLREVLRCKGRSSERT